MTPLCLLFVACTLAIQSVSLEQQLELFDKVCYLAKLVMRVRSLPFNQISAEKDHLWLRYYALQNIYWSFKSVLKSQPSVNLQYCKQYLERIRVTLTAISSYIERDGFNSPKPFISDSRRQMEEEIAEEIQNFDLTKRVDPSLKKELESLRRVGKSDSKITQLLRKRIPNLYSVSSSLSNTIPSKHEIVSRRPSIALTESNSNACCDWCACVII